MPDHRLTGPVRLAPEYLAVAFVAALVLFRHLDRGTAWWMAESDLALLSLDLARTGQLGGPAWYRSGETDSLFTRLAPVYVLWLALFLKLAGFSEFTARAASAVLGIVAIVAVYAVVRRTTRDPVAALAAVGLLLLDPTFRAAATEVRMEILVAAGAIGSWLGFLAGRPVAAGLAAAVIALAHPNGAVLGPATLLAGLILHWPRARAFALAAVAFAVPVGAYVAGAAILLPGDQVWPALDARVWAERLSLSGLAAGVKREWVGRYLGYWQLSGPASTTVALLALAALPLTARGERRWATLLPVLGLIGYWIVVPTNPWPRFLTVLWPFGAVWMGWLVARAIVGIARHGRAFAWPPRWWPIDVAAGVVGLALVGVFVAVDHPAFSRVGDDPLGRAEMRRLALRIPDGSRALGHLVFWREFANRRVSYHTPEEVLGAGSGEAVEAALRALHPEYLLLEPAMLNPNAPEEPRGRVARLALCFGTRLDVAQQVPYFGPVWLFRVDWRRDTRSPWPAVDWVATELASVPLTRLAARAGTRVDPGADGARFRAPRSRWDNILAWELPAALFEPGRYVLQVTGRMIEGAVEVAVHDAAERLTLGRTLWAGREPSTVAVSFEVGPRGSEPLKAVVWNYAGAVPGGARAEGVIQAISVARLGPRCRRPG